jgi:hypothetical protein
MLFGFVLQALQTIFKAAIRDCRTDEEAVRGGFAKVSRSGCSLYCRVLWGCPPRDPSMPPPPMHGLPASVYSRGSGLICDVGVDDDNDGGDR